MKANCYVVVNSGENPDAWGRFETPEDVYEHYERFDTFTQRVFSSLRAANAEMNRLDKEVPDGGTCYVVCGVYCRQFAKHYIA